jgi:hypothetical protein
MHLFATVYFGLELEITIKCLILYQTRTRMIIGIISISNGIFSNSIEDQGIDISRSENLADTRNYQCWFDIQANKCILYVSVLVRNNQLKIIGLTLQTS